MNYFCSNHTKAAHAGLSIELKLKEIQLFVMYYV